MTNLSNLYTINNISPVLPEDLDTNEHNILIDDSYGILDENGNEQLTFNTTTDAVNELSITNAASGTGPILEATGDDTDIDIILTPKGAGGVQLSDTLLKRPNIKDYAESINVLGDLGGGTDNIDLEEGNVVTATISTATQTFTFSNPPASGTAGSFTLILINGGSQTVNWPASVVWADGTAPDLTASGIDVLIFITTNAGSTWYGFLSGLNMN